MTQVKTPPRPREKPLKPRDSIYPDSVRKLFPPHFTDGDIAASLEGRPKITKIKKKRKGGNVKGYLAGDLINPLGGGTPGTPQGAGIGKGVAPQKKPPNPNRALNDKRQKAALEKKKIDLAAAAPAPKPGMPQAPGKPGMAPPGMAQKPPRALARKGGKMRKGDRVGGGPKSYSNICRSPVSRA